MAKIDSRDFVVAWMRAKTREDVMRDMKLTKQQVAGKALYLRKLGVKLPKLAGAQMDNLEIAQLNALIKKMERENGHG